MNFEKGTNKILYIDLGGTFFPVGCLTDNSFSEAVEVLDTTVRTNTDGWSSVVPTRQSYNISFNGVLTLDDAGGSILAYSSLQLFKRGRTKINWRINSQVGDTDSGTGYITSLSNSAAIDEFVSFSGEIVGVGLPVTSAMPPIITNKWIEIADAWVYKGTNGDQFQIEIGDMIRRYQSPTRYVHGRVNSLPYTDPNNLSLFEDITII